MRQLFSFAVIFVLLASTITGWEARADDSTGATTRADIDPLALLSQTLTAGGGKAAIDTVQDFVAHGTITYYSSATDTKTGQVTIRGRGDGQFRMDSDVQDGTRTAWAVSNGGGRYRDFRGQIGDVPFYNSVNAGWLTLPYMRLTAAIDDPGLELSYVGLQSINGTTFHQVRVSRHFDKQTDPRDLFAALRTADYYLTSTDLKIIGIVDKTHPQRSGIGVTSQGKVVTKGIERALYYSDFRPVNGIMVPFAIVEEAAHVRLWSIQLTDIAFNTGLAASDFTLQ